MTCSVLHNPHPPVAAVDASSFDYSSYPFEHSKAELSHDGVLLITLDRPKQLNAFSTPQCHSLIFLFELADRDERVRVVVLTGAGKAFCAGADLSGSGFGVESNLPAPISSHRDGGGQLVLSILNCRKLVIAAINGNAVGIGFTMTFAADLRICAEGAKLGTPFVKRGIPCDATSSYILPRLIGHSNATKLLLTGDLVPPTSPIVSSLFYSLHARPEDVLPSALSLASRLAKENSPASTALCKNQIWRPPGSGSIEEVHLAESQALAWCALHGDAKEGVDSFVQKRPANFAKTVKDVEAAEFYPWWNTLDVNGICTRGREHDDKGRPLPVPLKAKL